MFNVPKVSLRDADVASGWQKALPGLTESDFEELLMSTSAVSNSSLYQQLQTYFHTRNSDVQQLGQALSSGDLTDAQTAYNNIATLGQEGPFAQGNAFYSQTRDQDFNAIGQALQSGDLAGAQQAFAALKATGRNAQTGQTGNTNSGAGTSTAGGAVGPEIVINLTTTAPASATGTSATSPAGSTAATPAAPTSAAQNGQEIVLNLNDTGTATNPEQITIGISNSATGGEQISLSVGSQGSNPEQVTFNLGANSNEQIVLNLLNPPSATTSAASTTSTASATAGSTAGSGISVSA
jgi:hypothetical protein